MGMYFYRGIGLLTFTLAIPMTAFPDEQQVGSGTRELNTILSKIASYHGPDRQLVPGAYRSMFGTQLHPECFKGIGNQDRTKQAFDALLESAFRTVADKCLNRYPEFAPYIGEWVSQMQHTVVACSAKMDAQFGLFHAAVNLPWRSALREVLSETERAGIEADLDAHKPIIAFKKREMVQITSGYGDIIHSLIHEGFHSTHANNRGDHNELAPVGGMSFGKKDPCGNDRRVDRVYAVSALCSRDTSAIGYHPDVALFERINKCGEAKGCVDIFISEDHSWFGGMPSKALPKAKA